MCGASAKPWSVPDCLLHPVLEFTYGAMPVGYCALRLLNLWSMNERENQNVTESDRRDQRPDISRLVFGGNFVAGADCLSYFVSELIPEVCKKTVIRLTQIAPT